MGEDREPTGAELWVRVAAGEPGAFEQLFDRHANAIFTFCLRGTVALAEARAWWVSRPGGYQIARASSANASARREADGTSVPSS